MTQSLLPIAKAPRKSKLKSIHVIPAKNLEPAIIDAWIRLRNSNRDLASPYFDVEFTLATSRVRDDVFVAYEKSGKGISAILPFQLSGERTMVPVGGRLNDVHGVISKPGVPNDLVRGVMESAGFDSYSFHADVETDHSVKNYKFKEIGSYYLDISTGWEDYRKWVRKHSSTVARQGQKTRGLNRDVGPVRFEYDVRNEDILEQLIDMKRKKYQRSKTFDILGVDWASNMLREVYKVKEPGFSGLLSALWAGDELVAVHFGMITKDTLHYWFPVFDPAFSKYSPGTELLMQVAENAANRGIKKVDLGFGDDPYKLKFANATESYCCGQVTKSRLSFQIARQRYKWRNRLKGIPMKPFAKRILRKLYPQFGAWNFK